MTRWKRWKNEDGKRQQLTQLVEQAACSFNLLNPTDPSDVQALQDILHQIGEAAGGLDQGPVDLRRSLKRRRPRDAEVLQHILQQDVEDTAQAMDTVSQAICTLAGFDRPIGGPW